MVESTLHASMGDGAGFAREEHRIVKRVYTAVMEQRLPPGTKLSEANLCEAFGLGRLKVRRALLLLASQGIVDLHSNRGAFVAQPDRKDARDVFDARLALEPSIVRQVAECVDARDLGALERHIRLEQKAREEGDRREVIRLSGEFHVRLAAATGNAVMTRIVRELVTRTSLIIGLFGMLGVASCEEHEHRNILNAVSNHDANGADALIRAHLAAIEADLDLSEKRFGQPDLIEILSKAHEPTECGRIE